ncbi:MAG: lasso peptide biosynthesis B2 protein [Nitrospirota bacterium]
MRITNTARSNFGGLEDGLLFLRIFSLATVLPILVKMLSIPGLMRIITPRNPESETECSDQTVSKIEKYTDYILGRNFWIYKISCLKRSLLLYRFMRQEGVYVNICFGVKYASDETDEKRMDGHAWLLYKGDIFLEKDIHVTRTYTMTYCYPEIGENVKDGRLVTIAGGLK